MLRIENPAHLLYETLKFVNFFFLFVFVYVFVLGGTLQGLYQLLETSVVIRTRRDDVANVKVS